MPNRPGEQGARGILNRPLAAPLKSWVRFRSPSFSADTRPTPKAAPAPPTHLGPSERPAALAQPGRRAALAARSRGPGRRAREEQGALAHERCLPRRRHIASPDFAYHVMAGPPQREPGVGQGQWGVSFASGWLTRCVPGRVVDACLLRSGVHRHALQLPAPPQRCVCDHHLRYWLLVRDTVLKAKVCVTDLNRDCCVLQRSSLE